MRIVSGKFRGTRLVAPKGVMTRPTTDRVRESLFNILSNTLNFEGIRVLDMFAGTGALGIEALSRGADFAVFIENGPQARRALQHNINRLGLEARARVLKSDATRIGAKGTQNPFNVVFADPPYGQNLGVRAAMSLAEGGWLSAGAILVLEEDCEHVPENLNGFERLDLRLYGSSAIGIFQYRKHDEIDQFRDP